VAVHGDCWLLGRRRRPTTRRRWERVDIRAGGRLLRNRDLDHSQHPTDTSCDAQLDLVLPIHEEAQVPTDTVIDAYFTDKVTVDGWELSLAGVPGSVSLAEDRRSASFYPDAPLDHDTAYTVQARACSDQRSSTFHTVLAPIDLADLDGHVYDMPYPDFTWHKPNSAAFLHPFVDFESVIMEIGAGSGTTFEARFTAKYPGGMPLCSSVVDTTGDAANNPDFSTGAADLDIPVTFSTVTVEDVAMQATFADGGARIDDITMTGRVDVRGFEPLLLGLDVCGSLAPLFGDTCVPCSDGQAECLDAQLTMPSAPHDRASLGITAWCGP